MSVLALSSVLFIWSCPVLVSGLMESNEENSSKTFVSHFLATAFWFFASCPAQRFVWDVFRSLQQWNCLVFLSWFLLLLLVQIFFFLHGKLVFSNLTFSDPLKTSLPQLWTMPLGRNKKGRELNFTVSGELRYIVAIAVSWVSSSWAVQMCWYKTCYIWENYN